MKHAMILFLLLLYAAVAQITPKQLAQMKSSDQHEQGANHGGAITGRVISLDGQPIASAEVSAIRLTDVQVAGHSVACDEEGNFTLRGLSPGAYRLSARMPGFVSADLPLENDIHRLGENVIISLVKGGVITGRVTDELGEPLVGVTVEQRRLRNLEGKTTMPGDQIYYYAYGRTDDRGIYRIYGLRPGSYILSISGSGLNSNDDAQIWRDAPTYYPSATRESAVEILLHDGEDISGIDIRHRGERGRIVSGYFAGGTELSYRFITVTMDGFGGGVYEATNLVSSTRGFVFFGVPDGEYEMTAIGSGGEITASVTRRISVKGADVSGVELKLVSRGSITGRVVIESSNPQKGCANSGNLAENHKSVAEEIVLRAVSDDADHPVLPSQYFSYEMFGRTPNTTGEFTLKNLDSGRYRIAVDLPDDGWYIRTINQSTAVKNVKSNSAVDLMRNGISIKPGDKLSGVDVIVAEGAAMLQGRVVTAKDKLPSRVRVYLIPSESASADDVIRYGQVDTRDDGAFQFKHITPGKYLIYARRLTEKETNEDQPRPLAWNATERAKLRRAAMAEKNEIELQSCERVKDFVLRYMP